MDKGVIEVLWVGVTGRFDREMTVPYYRIGGLLRGPGPNLAYESFGDGKWQSNALVKPVLASAAA